MESLRIQIGSSEQEFPRRDVKLFTFLGHSATHGDISNYDHIYLVKRNSKGKVTQGIYMFKDEEIYPEVKEFIEKNDFPQVINQPSIDPSDIEAFEALVYCDVRIQDSFPEAWVEIAD